MNAVDVILHQSYAQQALVTGIAVGTVCSLLSVVVVLKRMAFIGQGISHAGFGGMGLAIFLGLAGWQQDALLFVFCLATGLIIGLLSRRRRVDADTAIGILLVAAMAIGVILTDLRTSLRGTPWYDTRFASDTFIPPIESMLFGSLLLIDTTAMWWTLGLSVLIVVVCAAFFKEIVFFTFDERVSRVFGVPTNLIYYLLLIALSLTIVLSIRVVGVLLVTALLVIPGATALLLTRRLAGVLAVSWGVGMVGVVGGLVVALQLGEFSTGACIVAVLCLLFATAFASRAVLR